MCWQCRSSVLMGLLVCRSYFGSTNVESIFNLHLLDECLPCNLNEIEEKGNDN